MHRLRADSRRDLGGRPRPNHPDTTGAGMTTDSTVRQRTRDGVGRSAPRPDAQAKVSGQFAFSSDLYADQMLWAHILRSPYPHALIKSIDIGPALARPGVAAVLTAGDVPGSPLFGSERAD